MADDVANANECIRMLNRDVKSKKGRQKRAEFFRAAAERRNNQPVEKAWADYIKGL